MPDDAVQEELGDIELVEIRDEVERSFLDYAMSVITARVAGRATASSPCSAGSSTACTPKACVPTASTRSRRRPSAR